MVGREGQRRIVKRCCERALRAGVRPGLPVSEAQALLREDARLEEWAPDREKNALRALALWAHRFSPLVTTEEPDRLLIDISGSQRLFGSDAALADRVIRAAGAIGLRARAGVASTFACARAALLSAPEEARLVVVPDGQERQALRDLPLSALELEAPCLEALRELGIERIGQLMELPRSALPARFGEAPLRRLGEALGEVMETIEPLRPVASPEVERLFEGPATQWEAIELASRELLERLCRLLRERESGLRLATLTLERVDAPPVEITISLSAPSRNARHLWSLLRPRLERANMGDGVERLALCAPRIARMRHEQAGAWREEDRAGAREADRAFGELIDTLVNRLGPQRTLLIESVSSHMPERAFALRAATEGAPRPPDSPAPPETLPGDRPFVLLEKPEPIAVMALTPDGPVLTMRWRGEDRRIVATIGPERLGPEWWRSMRAVTRDYFKAQDEHGRWLWLCRALDTGAWFVHGLWS